MIGYATTRESFKADPQNQIRALQFEAQTALGDFRYFAVVTMGYDGRRGLSKRQREAGLRSQDADAIDYSDPAYDAVFEFLRRAETSSSLLMLPRFTGKTTLVALWCLWLALRNANIRIGIVGYDQGLAESILGLIKQWVLTDKKSMLRRVFGPLGYLPPLDEKWGRNDAVIFPRRTVVSRDATITAVSMRAASEGGHFDLLLLEDLVNLKSSQTKASLEEVRNFVKQSSGLGVTRMDDRGNVTGRAPKVMIGTPWDDEDAYMRAIAETAEDVRCGKPVTWNILRLPCRVARKVIERETTSSGVLRLVEREEYDESCKPRFRHQTDETLKAYRYARDGFGPVAYASQMDLRPVPLGNRMMKKEWFEDHFYEDKDIWEFPTGGLPKLKVTIAAVGFSDLAGSAGESKDRTAHLAIGTDPRGHLYILDATAGRFAPSSDDPAMTPNANLNIMAEWTHKYRFHFIGVEGGVLRTVYEPEALRWNRTHPDRPVILRKVASGGARGNRTNDRAMAIAAMAERGEIHLKREHADLLEELLRYTPEADNSRDDYVAALALACLNRQPWGVVPQEEEKRKGQVQEMFEHARRMAREGEAVGGVGQYAGWEDVA